MLQVSNARSDLNRLRAKLMLAEAAVNAPESHDHAVQFYEDDGFLVNIVAQFTANGIALGEPVIIVASEAHATALVVELHVRGVDVDGDKKAGRLTILDARKTLASFMRDGKVDVERFRSVIAGALAHTPPRGMNARIRTFGEMVDLLWQDGNGSAAAHLERLWNEVVAERDLSLLCAYSMTRFPNAEHTQSIEEICGLHTHVLPTERFIERDGAGRRAEIVLLQQRAQALETELGRSRSLESKLRRAAAAAKRAKSVAERANLAKSQFLAIMSHELRTPLNAISGYTELLEMGIHGPVTDEQRDALLRIQRNQRHLLSLINEVLDYAKLETGSLRYDIVDVSISEALHGAETLVLPQIAAKGLRYTQSGADTLTVRADREKLHKILVNLLTNAAKFTPDGGEVAIECSADESTVCICVRDTGIGIPPERLAAIFDPFIQMDTNYTRTNQGIGLGLAISRELAHGMNGVLSVESLVGHGSAFTLALPRLAR